MVSSGRCPKKCIEKKRKFAFSIIILSIRFRLTAFCKKREKYSVFF